MKVLLVATRDPYGRLSGRRAVLRTIVRACAALDHEVRVLAVTREQLTAGDVPVVALRPPRLPRILLNVLTRATTGRLSLNECLYVSPALLRAVRRTAAEWGADVVVADMLRTASLALATTRPTIIDLDDLLSTRYRSLSQAPSSSANLLGYYGASLPAVLARPLGWGAARLLAVEARLVARRERQVAQRATVVSLVAEEEAAAFQDQVGRRVAWLPMAVPVPSATALVAANPSDRLVFVGGLDYQPNLDAVRRFVHGVAPALAARGAPDARLRVVGHCPEAVRAELAGSSAVELLGFVDDLAAELAGARAFVAPIPPGTGVKTKVLEAMAAGLPVVSTPHGIDGIGVRHGDSCLVGGSDDELAGAVIRMQDDPALAARIGAAGRAVVAERFAQDVVTARWRDALAEATGDQQAPG